MLRVEYAPFLSSKHAYCPLECRARCLRQQLEMNVQGTCPLYPYGSLPFSGCKKRATNMNLSPRQRNTERTWCLTSVTSEGPPCTECQKQRLGRFLVAPKSVTLQWEFKELTPW